VPPSILAETVFWLILPAAGASAGMFAACLRLGGPRTAFPASALAFAAGFLLANALGPALPLGHDETHGLHRLSWAAAATLVAGQLARLPAMPVLLGWALRLAGSALAAWLLAPAADESLPSWLPCAFAAVVLAEWVVGERSTQRPAGAGGLWALAVSALAASGVLLHAHFGRAAEASLILAGALAGVAAVAWLRGVDGGGAVPAAAVLLPGLLLVGQATTFSEVPRASFVLAALSPLALAPSLPGFFRRLAGPRMALLRLGLVLVPAALAVALAMRAESVDFDQARGGDGYVIRAVAGPARSPTR
jgi:hypothetical protein